VGECNQVQDVTQVRWCCVRLEGEFNNMACNQAMQWLVVWLDSRAHNGGPLWPRASMEGNGRAPSIPAQHVVGHPHWDLLPVCRVDSIAACAVV